MEAADEGAAESAGLAAVGHGGGAGWNAEDVLFRAESGGSKTR